MLSTSRPSNNLSELIVSGSNNNAMINRRNNSKGIESSSESILEDVIVEDVIKEDH